MFREKTRRHQPLIITGQQCTQHWCHWCHVCLHSGGPAIRNENLGAIFTRIDSCNQFAETGGRRIGNIALRFPWGGTAYKNPSSRKYEKNTKKLQNPPFRVGPEKNRKNTKKLQKRSENGHFHNFSGFFLYFWGPTRNGGFCLSGLKNANAERRIF